jgi:hypothetical protein
MVERLTLLSKILNSGISSGSSSSSNNNKVPYIWIIENEFWYSPVGLVGVSVQVKSAA